MSGLGVRVDNEESQMTWTEYLQIAAIVRISYHLYLPDYESIWYLQNFEQVATIATID